MSEWQPIETAPKDGTEFLGHVVGSYTTYIDDSNPIIGCYPGGHWKVAHIKETRIFFFNGKNFMDITTALEYGPNFIETTQPEGSPDGDPPLTLTHWMPLPEPPK